MRTEQEASWSHGSYTQEAERNEQEVGPGCKPQKPRPLTHFLHQGSPRKAPLPKGSISFPNSTTNFRLTTWRPEHVGAIETTTEVSCPRPFPLFPVLLSICGGNHLSCRVLQFHNVPPHLRSRGRKLADLEPKSPKMSPSKPFLL